jgi:simple sugar transport system permease protein
MINGVSSALGILTDAAFWMAAIALAAPLLIAALGALICGQTGVLAFGIEGIFAAGALAALLAAHFGRGHWTALLVAAAAGALIGLISGTLTSPLNLPQRTTGLAITLLAAGLCQFIYTIVFAGSSAAPAPTPFGPIDLYWFFELTHTAALSRLPYVKEFCQALFHATPPVYAAVLLTLVVSYVINRTPLGLALQVCGEDPAAITAQGRSVHALRIGASTVGSALMALGGGTVVLTSAGTFSFSLVSGRGFAALVLAIIAGWRVGRILIAVLVFAMIDAYQLHLQHRLGGPLALTLSPLLPYAIALVVLIATSRSTMRRFPLPPD